MRRKLISIEFPHYLSGAKIDNNSNLSISRYEQILLFGVYLPDGLSVLVVFPDKLGWLIWLSGEFVETDK